MFTFKNYCDRMLGCVEIISSGRIRREEWHSRLVILHRINSGLHTAQDQQWASYCTRINSGLHTEQGSTVGFMLHRIK